MFRKILLGAVLIAGSSASMAGITLLQEGFDAGSGVPAGWATGNFSVPVGTTGWFQGNSGIFAADAGAADSYIAANFLNAADGGNVDNWLATPFLAANGYTQIDFAARTAGGLPGDQIEVLVNSIGTSFLADFVSLGTLSSLASDSWGHYSFAYEGGAANLRFAFRYLVTDTSANGDYIGIDSISVRTVPEPGTLALMAAGMLLAPLLMRRRRSQAQI